MNLVKSAFVLVVAAGATFAAACVGGAETAQPPQTCEPLKNFPCMCDDGTTGTDTCDSDGQPTVCRDGAGNFCKQREYANPTVGGGGSGGECDAGSPYTGGTYGTVDPDCVTGLHTIQCHSGDGFCDPKTLRCCTKLDPDCCAGCLTTEVICGKEVDVCLAECPTGQVCGANDARCHLIGM